MSPEFPESQVKAIVAFSADDFGAEGRDHLYGYGRINAANAIALADAKRFVISDNDGDHICSFDDQGNFVVESVLIPNADSFSLAQKASEDFHIFDTSGTGLVRVFPNVAFYIKGQLYERKTGFGTPPAGSLLIEDSSSNIVAFINSISFSDTAISSSTIPAGSVILTGRAYMGEDADRDSSQGN